MFPVYDSSSGLGIIAPSANVHGTGFVGNPNRGASIDGGSVSVPVGASKY